MVGLELLEALLLEVAIEHVEHVVRPHVEGIELEGPADELVALALLADAEEVHAGDVVAFPVAGVSLDGLARPLDGAGKLAAALAGAGEGGVEVGVVGVEPEHLLHHGVALVGLAAGLVVGGEQGEGGQVVGVHLEHVLELFPCLVVAFLHGEEGGAELAGDGQVGVDLERRVERGLRGLELAVAEGHDGEAGVGDGAVGVELEGLLELLGGVFPGILADAVEAGVEIGVEVLGVGAVGFGVGAPGAVGVVVFGGDGHGGESFGGGGLALAVEAEEVVGSVAEGILVACDAGELEGEEAGAHVVAIELAGLAQAFGGLLGAADGHERLGVEGQRVGASGGKLHHLGGLGGGLLGAAGVAERADTHRAGGTLGVGGQLGLEQGVEGLEAIGILALGDGLLSLSQLRALAGDAHGHSRKGRGQPQNRRGQKRGQTAHPHDKAPGTMGATLLPFLDSSRPASGVKADGVSV